MSKHAKPETPLERADRLISELSDESYVNGLHRADTAYLEISPHFASFQEQINNMIYNMRQACANFASIKDWA
ncbi:hypothetical protein [Glutamicibacter sp. MCAF14]|uniref:hypothetical protein n=1 Tax=Glutamicibacter sp. MCAF14 TaxID=3233043 RepID=UPI003F92B7F2